MKKTKFSGKISRSLLFGFFLMAGILAAAFILIADNAPRGMCSANISLLTWNVADITDTTISTPLFTIMAYPDQPQINWLNQNAAIWNIAFLQEDFSGHIYNGIKSAYSEYQNNTSSGLSSLFKASTLSSYSQHWNTQSCFNEYDCLSGKGFLHTVVNLPVKNAAGWTCNFPIHVYNLHADAGNTEADRNARRQQFSQLSNYMNSNSAGYSVILAGDFNCDYRDWTDRYYILTEYLIKPQNLTMANDPAMNTSVDGGTLDYILFKTGDSRESLQKTSSTVYGYYLSDHLPVEAKFQYSVNYDAFPDVVVSDILKFEYYRSTKKGVAHITVRNNGPAASPSSVVSFTITGLKGLAGSIFLPKLNSGESILVKAVMTGIPQDDLSTPVNITAVADCDPWTKRGYFRENNDLNNSKSKYVNVQYLN